MRKAQTWSMDTIIAFGVFFAALALFLIYIGTQADSSQDIKKEAQALPSLLDSAGGQIPLITGGKLDKNILSKISTTDYATLKNQLGLRNEFCIYVTDSAGKLVNIQEILDSGETAQYGIGSSQFNLTNSVQCGS